MAKQDKALEARRKFVSAYSRTLVEIWKEKIRLMKIMDSLMLLETVTELPDVVNNDYTDFRLSQRFLEYGFYQNWGVGRETPAGQRALNGTPRRPRRWFDRKYYGSYIHLRDFYADNLGQRFVNIISNALRDVGIKADLRAGKLRNVL